MDSEQAMKELAAKQQQEARDFMEKFHNLTHRVFKQNKDGQEWLALVTDHFVLKQLCADPSKESSHGFFREGQNTFIRLCHEVIEAVEKKAEMNRG